MHLRRPSQARLVTTRPAELTTLPLRVRYREGEPAYGLFGRLAARNLSTSCRQFGRLVGLDYSAVCAGRKIEELARLAGLHAPDIARNTVMRQSNGSLMYAGTSFGVQWWARPQRRYCPACFRDDLRGNDHEHGPRDFRPFRRAYWDLKLIENCPVHRCELLHTCPACERLGATDQTLPWVCRCGADLSKAPRVRSSSDCALDQYLVGRLGGCAPLPVPVLDGMPLDIAVQAAFHVGSLVEHGGHRRRNDRDLRSMSGPRRRGFAVLREWPQAFADALDRHFGDEERVRTNRTLYGTPYGILRSWTSRRSLSSFAEPVRIAMRQHALRLPVTGIPDDLVSDSKFVTIHPAAREAGMHPGRFVTLAERTGIAPRRCHTGRTVWFESEAVAAVTKLAEGQLTLREASEFLGVCQTAFYGLHKAGLIDAASETGIAKPRYLKDDLASMLERISQQAPQVDRVLPGQVRLPDAPRRVNTQLRTIISAILAGQATPAGILTGEPGLRGVLLDLADLEVSLEELSDGIELADAARRCGLGAETLLDLARCGLVQSHRAPTRARRGYRFHAEDCDFFFQNYSTAYRLGREHGITSRRVRRILSAAATRPAFEHVDLDAAIYRRDEALAALAAAGAVFRGELRLTSKPRVRKCRQGSN